MFQAIGLEQTTTIKRTTTARTTPVISIILRTTSKRNEPEYEGLMKTTMKVYFCLVMSHNSVKGGVRPSVHDGFTQRAEMSLNFLCIWFL